MIDDYSLNSLVATKNSEKSVSNLHADDLDIKMYLLSSKSYVEIVSKDFAKNYQNVITVYQNEMGYLDKFQKVLAKNSNERIFVQYNDIIENGEKEIKLKNVITPIPLNMKQNSIKILQKSFDLVKYLTLQKMYRNNYSKHCINKIVEENEKTDNETKINLCLILLEHKNDLETKNVNYIFYSNLIRNFKTNLELSSKGQKKRSDEYNINVNFGITSLEGNKNIDKLYNDYMTSKNLKTTTEKHKLILVINDTQEKFTFKSFKDEKVLQEYLSEIDKSDYFEDSQFSYDYFADYHISEIKEIFNEDKIFSLSKIISTSFNAQMQPAYIMTFILLFIINSWYLKIEYLTAIAFATSITISLLWQIYNSFNF